MIETSTAPAEAGRERKPATRTIAPRVDIYDTDEMYVVLADMPGVTPAGLEVVVERDALILRGHPEAPAVQPDYREFELGDYHRTFMLTEDLDADRVAATLHDGVLRVQIPKSPRVQPKKIPIRTE
jgi:HSP20 family molecular chaperone IbpA